MSSSPAIESEAPDAGVQQYFRGQGGVHLHVGLQAQGLVRHKVRQRGQLECPYAQLYRFVYLLNGQSKTSRRRFIIICLASAWDGRSDIS